MDWKLFVITFSMSVTMTTCSPRYLITMPAKIRYNVEETMTLTVTEVSNLQVLIIVQDYPDKLRNISSSVVVADQDHLSTSTIRVRLSDLPETDEEDRQVYVMAESLDTRLPFRDEAVIPLTKRSGFIFIQTDKPIYTPNQSVKMRIIPLDERRLPATDQVITTIVNPQGITVQRWESAWSQRFITHELQLPDTPMFGRNWTVNAKFINNERNVRASVPFEVREYVLPRFSVSINTGGRHIILPTTFNFTIQVSAKFVYGKTVNGDATIKLGVVADGRDEFCPFVFRKPLIKGSAAFDVELDDIASSLESFWYPDGARLKIQAEVLEIASGRKERNEDTSIAFVQQPFLISTLKSHVFFKPGLLYDLQISSMWSNKQVAQAVPLNIFITKVTRSRETTHVVLDNQITNNDGNLIIHINTLPSHDFLNIRIQTNHVDYHIDQQTEETVDVEASNSRSGQFMKLSAIENGTSLTVTADATVNIDDKLFYLILSGSSLVKSGTVQVSGRNSTTLQIPVQSEMWPLSRIVAYCFIENSNGPDILSDSVIIQFSQQCDGNQLTISTDREEYRPGDAIGATIHVQGSPNSVVGLLAVDTSIYLMNNKKSLDISVVENAYKEVGSGCGEGGGQDTTQVFQDSALSVMSNSGSSITSVTDCTSPRRQRRSTDALLDSSLRTHPCCVAGDLFSRNASDATECYEEGKLVYTLTNNTSCSKVFYVCCKLYVPTGHTGYGKTVRLGTIEYTFRDIEDGGVVVRSYFPESWGFEADFLDQSGHLVKNIALPHSITSHVISAISLSPWNGLCIANTVSIATYQDFFIDLDLPYSMVRLEQTEVRAIIYNYGKRTLPVYARMQETDGICSSRSKSGFIPLRVQPNSAEMITFPIVPLAAGEFTIDIVARSVRGIGDRIQKKVLVINEGQEKVKSVSFWLDPFGQKGRTQHDGDIEVQTSRPSNRIGVQKTTVDLVLPEEAIPGTGKCKVTAIGNIMDTTVRTVIDNVDNLLNRMPHGCGEQTIINLAPVVYSIHYLLYTGQARDEILNKARRMIHIGYQKELLFRKSDGSFCTWAHKPSSTWLTAFVIKVFCEAQRYTHIDPMVICSGMEYLLSQQRPDGSFQDEYPVYHKEMLGGNIGQVSRTAFILITLLECDCRPPGTDANIQRAVRFLENSLDYINQVYPLAVTTYALALANSVKKREANNKLRLRAIERPFTQNDTRGTRFWTVSDEVNNIFSDVPYWYRRYPDAIDVEVTAYALLAQMELDEIIYSDNIVEWLLYIRKSSGAFVSTQDTVIALQALSMYSVRTYARDLDLRMTLETSSNRTFRQDMTLSQDDIEIEKAVHDIPLNGHLNVTTEGSGVARMEVEVRYNVNVSEHDVCKFHIEVFDSDVQLGLLQTYGYTPRELKCDVCGSCRQVDPREFPEMSDIYNVPDLDPRIRGLSRGTNRVGRSIPRIQGRIHGASKQQICIEICVSYLGYNELDMPVIDIGLPTGFRPQTDDFNVLKDERIIDNFEVSKRSVILYLTDIPSDSDLCFKFRVIKEFEVENLQAAKIEVFDYYKSEERCVKFYSLKYDVADLDIFCSRSECHCVEGSCADQWDAKLEFRQISRAQLFQRTCREFDYVVKIEVTNIGVSGNHIVISSVVTSALKAGTGNIRHGDELDIWMNLRCSTQIEENEQYFIYGKAPIQYVDEDGYKRYRYYLQGETAIFKDYTRNKYATTASLRYWQRFIRQMERYIRRRGCST